MITIIDEGVMSRDTRIYDTEVIRQLLISDRFNEYLKTSDLMDNPVQSSIDLAEAINMLYNGSAVARPVTYPVLTTEQTISPKNSLIIEFNNKYYDLSGRKYDLWISKSAENYSFTESMIDEYLVPDIEHYASERCYRIRDAIISMIIVR